MATERLPRGVLLRVRENQINRFRDIIHHSFLVPFYNLVEGSSEDLTDRFPSFLQHFIYLHSQFLEHQTVCWCNIEDFEDDLFWFLLHTKS